MTIKSINELLLQAETTLPDNTTQLISPADVRQLIVDFLDTVSPYYGAILLTSQALALTGTPKPLAPFGSVVEEDTGAFTVNVTNGSVTRKIASAALTGATTFLTVSGSVSGANNSNVTITLYKNGVATPYRVSVTCTGVGDRVGFSLSALSYNATDDAVYSLAVASSNSSSHTFTDVVFVAQAQPVRSFT